MLHFFAFFPSFGARNERGREGEQKREDASLFVLMKENGGGGEGERARKHYLNWAISPDDYVCGFANCNGRCTAMVKRVATSNKKLKLHYDCCSRKSSKFPVINNNTKCNARRARGRGVIIG